MMKGAVAVLALVVLVNGASARTLQQNVLPTLSSVAPAISPVTAAAPGPLAQGACALAALQQSGNFTTLLTLIQAASESTTLQNLLNANNEQATILAPTDGGIQKTLSSKGLTAASLLADPTRITDVLEYHILPSQLQAKDLQNGFSFNTLYESNTVAQSVAVQGNGVTSTIVGAASSAPIISSLTACQFVVYPIDGLLLPN